MDTAERLHVLEQGYTLGRDVSDLRDELARLEARIEGIEDNQAKLVRSVKGLWAKVLPPR